jgi:3-oxoacyl-[acyl-carrier protein] reductase
METALKGKSVLITGASQGMGRATAEAFAREGARIAICARNATTIQKAADEIRKTSGAEVVAGQVDVTDHAALERFVLQAAEQFGGVDVCVANGGGPDPKPFAAISVADWRGAFELNFLSFAVLAKLVLPYMQKNKWGRYIAITSTSVRQAIPDLVLSTSIRPAVVGMIKSLAIEYGPQNITFNNVAPGYTLTERLSHVAGPRAQAAGVTEEEIHSRWAADVPLRRLGKPQEIADTIVWLASKGASYVTGQTLLVDGGIYKGM